MEMNTAMTTAVQAIAVGTALTRPNVVLVGAGESNHGAPMIRPRMGLKGQLNRLQAPARLAFLATSCSCPVRNPGPRSLFGQHSGATDRELSRS
jgi:hypothetical protein